MLIFSIIISIFIINHVMIIISILFINAIIAGIPAVL